MIAKLKKLLCRWFGICCPTKPPLGTENVLISRPGAFAIAFVASSTTGYYAVKDEFGAITIHASGTGTLLDFTSTFCHLWPCWSATDSYNTGNLTDLQADGVQGMQGALDLTGLSKLEQIVVSQHPIDSLTLTGCTSLSQISVYNCMLRAPEVNAVLIQTDANGVHGGTLSITGNEAPINAGLTAKANLLAKGWIVDTD